MAQSLHQVWTDAAANPFTPIVGKDSQFSLGFLLLAVGILLSGYFGMSKYLFFIGLDSSRSQCHRPFSCEHSAHRYSCFIGNWIRRCVHDMRSWCLCLDIGIVILKKTCRRPREAGGPDNSILWGKGKPLKSHLRHQYTTDVTDRFLPNTPSR
jgi:hypothetical protein